MRLEGTVAIITGASRGIGAAVAKKFAAEGANLVLANRSSDTMSATVAACRDAGAEVLAVHGDIGATNTATRWCDATLERFGRVDVLVNNAGVACEQLLLTLTDEQLELVVATNILGLTKMAQVVLKPMLRQRRGVIINLSSVAASRPGRGQAIYAGTKGFVESFTRALAVEVGRKGIRVNAVAPGVVETDMTASVLASVRKEIEARVALRRIGSVEEIASAVAFLASDDASYVTGAVLATDGGFSGGM